MNPFAVTALPPNQHGDRLLVGRDAEVRSIQDRLCDPPKAITLEGPNGVGKTSIANVAVYRALEMFRRGETEFLFAMASDPLQITSEDDTEKFLDKVYYAVAQSLIKITKDPEVVRYGSNLKNQASIDKWLNFAEAKGWSAGIPWLNFGKSASTNSSDGFTRSGFRNTINQWLQDYFPDGEGGGVVCILDNLEILQESRTARDKLEELRDPAFSIPGIRWILCGASGIVRAVASTPRLEGILHTPIEVAGIPEAKAVAILQSRVTTYSAFETQPFLPITEQSFSKLYSILRSNIRSTLSSSDNYCRWVDSAGQLERATRSPDDLFVEWLKMEHGSVMNDVQKRVKKTAWKVFDKAVELGGQFAPGDFDDFGFNSASALRTHILALEGTGLISSSVDETDSRRKSISITPRGWMVHHARTNGFETLFAPDEPAD